MRNLVSRCLLLVALSASAGCVSLASLDESADVGIDAEGVAAEDARARDAAADGHSRDAWSGDDAEGGLLDAGLPPDDAGIDLDAATEDAATGLDASPTPPDGGMDAGLVIGIDGGMDAGLDAGSDGGMDAGRDGGPPPADAGRDAGAPRDAWRADARGDIGPVDACYATPETCDGADDDCDGVIDNGLSIPCSTGVGACARTGTRVCAAGAYGSCSAVAGAAGVESCNGIDDDCDGTVDDGLPPGASCTSGTGACVRSGTLTCAAGTYSLCSVGPSAAQGLTCADAIDLGDFPDTRASRSWTGDAIARDVWYRFRAVDTPDATCDEFNVGIHLIGGAAEHEIWVVRGTCATGEMCPAGTYTDYNFALDMRETRGGVLTGECPCWTGLPVTDRSPCEDSTTTISVRVRRRAGAPATCSTYTLAITNGID